MAYAVMAYILMAYIVMDLYELTVELGRVGNGVAELGHAIT